MDAATNPYMPGAGLRPPALTGRDMEIERFSVLRRRVRNGLTSRSVMMSGLRGVGKTVLLNELASAAREDGWLVAKVEADISGRRRPFASQVAAGLSSSARRSSSRRRMGERLVAALGTLRSFSLGLDPTGRLSIGVDVDPRVGRADTGLLEADLVDLTLDLGEGLREERSVGVAIFIDELQDLSADELAAVCQACHESGQAEVPFYVVGAGLPSIPSLLAESRSYAERLFDFWTVGALSADAAKAALVVPAERHGASWDPAAVERVTGAANGYPYFLQEFGRETWDCAPGPIIELADAQAGVVSGTERLDGGFYASRWDRATRAERDYLGAMAADGEEVSYSGKVAERLGKKPTAVAGTRASLLAKGLIFAPEHGRLAFTVPGMAAFVARQSP